MDMTATLTGQLADQLADARAKHAEGVRLQKAAADMLRDVARQLRDAGWKGKDIAPALGVNQQRVSQLLAHPS